MKHTPTLFPELLTNVKKNKSLKVLKILNLYSGIGGNRKLWDEVYENIEVVAVEHNKAIAEAYKDRYPNDTVVVADAMQYLLKHYHEFDFVWASPPCQTHTRILHSQKDRNTYDAKYPDMSLYKIILFLKLHSNKFKYVVENVRPFYDPLIEPDAEIDRHMYWSNFAIPKIEVKKMYIHNDVTNKSIKDFDIAKYGNIKNKRQVVRNQVNYDIGAHILKSALKQMEVK